MYRIGETGKRQMEEENHFNIAIMEDINMHFRFFNSFNLSNTFYVSYRNSCIKLFTG